MRARVALVLLVGLGLVAVVSGAAELPLMPPVDVAQSSTSSRSRVDSAAAATSQVELLMIRLIRTFFGDQVKWSPFLRSDPVAPTPHHRIVHQRRPRCRPHPHDEDLAKQRYRLRGEPFSATPTPRSRQPQQ